MRDMVYRDKVCPSPALAASSLIAFESGNVGMYMDFAGLASRYRDIIHDFDWDIAPTPSDADNIYTMVKGNEVVVTAQSRHPQESWEWIKYLTGAESERYICGDAYRRSVPTQLSLLRSPEYLHATQRPFHIDVFVDLIDRGRSLPIDETWFTWTTTAHRSMDRLFLENTTNTATILRSVARAADDEITHERERYARYTNRPLVGAATTTQPSQPAGVAHAE